MSYYYDESNKTEDAAGGSASQPAADAASGDGGANAPGGTNTADDAPYAGDILIPSYHDMDAPKNGNCGNKDRRRSSWWLLMPIVLGVIGGIIAYFALRRDDQGRARDCLILGVILTAVWAGLEAAMHVLPAFGGGAGTMSLHVPF